jgi:hypothetical protein
MSAAMFSTLVEVAYESRHDGVAILGVFFMV